MTTSNRAIRFGFFETGIDWSQLQVFLDAMPDGVVAVDAQGVIVAINAEAEQQLKYRHGQLVGQAVETLLPDAMRREHRQLRDDYAQHPYARPMGAGRNLCARQGDGSELPVDISLSPLLVGGQKIVLAVMRDVSERRETEAHIQRLNNELEERVRRRTAELEAANRTLEEYAYAVSHELRSPLRIVRGFSELLERDLKQSDSAPTLDHLGHIVTAAKRMSEIVEGLLSLARLDHHDLKCTPVDMEILAQNVVEELRDEVAVRHVDFSIAPLPWALGDATLLHQVFANLLSNAVKYCGKQSNTAITVRGRRDGERAIYQVQDNGPGFNGQQINSIFDPFQRLAGADAMEGLGIGLTLVRRIVERHGGRIWAEGNAGGGATFTFQLPAADRGES